MNKPGYQPICRPFMTSSNAHRHNFGTTLGLTQGSEQTNRVEIGGRDFTSLLDVIGVWLVKGVLYLVKEYTLIYSGIIWFSFLYQGKNILGGVQSKTFGDLL